MVINTKDNKMVVQGIIINCLAMLSMLFFSYATFAANITVNVKDQHGQPLPDAVIELNAQSSDINTEKLPKLIMDQVDKRFAPTLLIARKGQQVNFPNSDNIRHHVYSFSKAKPFQLKLYSGQPDKPIEFDTDGVVVLGCNIHDSMVGYIYVASSEHVYQSDSNGNVVLDDVTLPAQLTFWHSTQTIPLEEKTPLALTKDAVGSVTVVIATQSPKPRNTFGNKFKANND